ncbi:ATP-binding protein [Actinomadura macrotermitis]|uniref:histidine kinase n=1 Tax=Actinomadura macrotermitis TaxID=2585200 RepID=A0A7K0C1F2_9ACTN|nr:ATP-binding protein [Actinomadura macrotermitis]MQY06614.1 hypothetical protein [Actinomadura macrotermitis]
MSAREAEPGRPPLERALIVWVAAVAVLGGAWLWALTAVPPAVRPLTAWSGGAAGLAVALVLAAVAHHAAAARRSRAHLTGLADGAARLERQAAELADGALPLLVRHIREGASPDAALAAAPRPDSAALRRLLHALAHEVAATERSAAAARACAASLHDELRLIAEETLPAAIERVRGEHATADRVLREAPRPADPLAARLLADAVRALADGERTAAATLTACASAAARLQEMITGMLAELHELQFRHDEQEVFDDLLDLDHRASRMGRLADGVALLAGGGSARRWPGPVPMEDVLRGALGRITDFPRVRLHGTGDAAVAGHAAEGVMHALAELLDNATAFSPPGTAVHVYVEEEDAGVIVTVEDGGLGMRPHERERAQRAVSEPPGPGNLPGPRHGLAVVGLLACRLGLRVSFRPSARGGTGVVVLIPRRLVTRQEAPPPLLRPSAEPLSVPAPADEPAALPDSAVRFVAFHQAGRDPE